jgi:dTMP kinase
MKNKSSAIFPPHFSLEGKKISSCQKGAFIVFEGLDGSGLSTQAKILRDFLKKEGFEVLLTKEPTKNSKGSKEIKKVLNQSLKLSPQKLQELFSQDRKEHLEKEILPALKKGKIVISDRYFFSTFAYGRAEGLKFNRLFEMNKDFLLPDITFILKVRPQVCFQRIRKRGEEKTLFEEISKLKKVWSFYKSFPKKFQNVCLIEGEKPIEEVAKEIQRIVLLKLKKEG